MNDALLEQIAALYQREHGAIAMVDVDSLEEIDVQRRNLIGRLDPLDPADRPLYDRVESLRARNERAAEAAVARLGAAIARVTHGRVALDGYRTSTGSSVLSRALDREI